MRHILVLGAGRSAPALVQYLRKEAREGQWEVFVGDLSVAAAVKLAGDEAHAIYFDGNPEQSREIIGRADVVISLLPPAFHTAVARLCLELGKSFFSASYPTPEMDLLDHEVRAKGLLFLNECGLDPGIDHMSALKLLQGIRKEGGAIESFESFTGGLIAVATDPGNPWRYKFTWNPGNVVLAGKATACYLQNGCYHYVPHHRLFRERIAVAMPDGEQLEAYANRDSLKYIALYGLEGVTTMLRGTLRYPGFCSAWDAFVQLGLCDDAYKLSGLENLTCRQFLESFLPPSAGSLEEKVARLVPAAEKEHVLASLQWSGFFEDEPVGLESGTPAAVLQHLLNRRWAMQPGDRDRVVMLHRICYTRDHQRFECRSGFSVEGDANGETAMATTVGVPLAMATQLFLQGKIRTRGVTLPLAPEFYEPILRNLEGRILQTQTTTSLLTSPT